MKTLVLSGWIQSPKALEMIFPGAETLDYSDLHSAEAVFQKISEIGPERLVGWSLGGVLAAQAVISGKISPKHLILLAVPYQFMADEQITEGCSEELWHTIRRDYQADAMGYARQFQRYVMHGHSRALGKPELHADAANIHRWLPWLDYLAESSFVRAGEAVVQPETTTIFHGVNDAVISATQAKYWSRIFPKSSVILLPETSHAPQFSPLMQETFLA